MIKSYERQHDNVGDIYRFCNDAHKWNTISKCISFSVIILFLIKEISHYLDTRSYIKIQTIILYRIILLLLNIGILIFIKCDKRGRSNLDQDEMYIYYVINLSDTCDRSVVFSGSSGFLHQ